MVATVIFLMFVAFLLQLLVALSLPIIKPIYLLSLESVTSSNFIVSSVATELRFGVWGFCATSDLNEPTLFSNDGACSSPRLGYSIPSSVLEITGQEELVSIILKALTVVLILHPICAGLSFIAFVPTIFSFIHGFAILALVLAVFSAIIATVSTAADIAIVRVAMNRIESLLEGEGLDFRLVWGNAPWMSLVAAILLWFVVIILSATLCGCCGISQRIWTRTDRHGNEIDDKGDKKHLNGTRKGELP